MSQNQIIEFSAPGKTILSGEHSVVYSKNALAMAIDLRTHVKIQINKKQQTQNAMNIEFKDENIIYDFKIGEVQNVLNKLDQQNLNEIMTFTSFQNLINVKPNQLIDIENLNEKQKNSKEIFAYIFLVVVRYHYQQIISIKEEQNSINLTQYKEKILKTMQNYQLNILSISKLPISKGLGSSASFNVALSASLFNMIDFLSGEQLKIDQQNFQNFQDLVNKISFDLEKIYHGNPSGIDNYIATYGGLVIFNRAKQQHKGIQSFNLPYKIYLIDSLVEKNTKKAVEKVSEIYHQENLKDIGQPAIQLIEHCTNKIIQILKDQSPKQQDEDIENAEQIYYQFGNLINMNQCLLKMFCLSNYQIEQINMISMKYNIPSKITGAGQGGYCLAFVPKKINKEQEQHFLDEIIQNGFTYMRADCASEGLKDDSK